MLFRTCRHSLTRKVLLKAERTMSEGVLAEYQAAVEALNGLQTNIAVRGHARQHDKSKLDDVERNLQHSGISLEQVDSLNVIHITGTKGKGSASAFCESILRHCGLKTGLFTSPHLVEVRERIRINGRPLSPGEFSQHFWECYSKFSTVKKEDMPYYFSFLTIMAFHVFFKEKVDAAVFEVGIGGAYDCTNIVRQPIACGITTLGFDHMGILGKTLAEIAWQKAGIFKPSRPAFTEPQQEEAMRVLRERAEEIGVKSLSVAPPLSTYGDIKPGLEGDHQRLNAALAIELCKAWMMETGRLPPPPEKSADAGTKEVTEKESAAQIPPGFIKGIENVHWCGRGQTVKRANVTYFLDGAHNIDSMETCYRWFEEASEREAKTIRSARLHRVLVFNLTGHRAPEPLLTLLKDGNFHSVIFCPNIASHTQGNSPDSTRVYLPQSRMHNQVVKNMKAWLEINEMEPLPPQSVSAAGSHTDEAFCPTVVTMNCIQCVLDWIKGRASASSQPSDGGGARRGEDVHYQVLVTGSMHLVGGVLGRLGFTAEEL